MTTEHGTQEIFIMDRKLSITPVQAPLSEWLKPNPCIKVQIDGESVYACKGGFGRFTEYAAFVNKEEAEAYKAAEERQKKPQKRRRG